MVIKVGINGFGRIGRVIFRTCFQNPEIKLTAINDPAIDIEYICYLIKFDSTHGKFRRNITHTENEITIDDHKINVFREKVPLSVPWHVAGVQYVVEASGMFTNLEKASGHLASEGVRRVIVTAPSVDIPMIILGVNEHTLNADQKVLSCTSSTLYCLAPMIKVLNDHFGVTEGFITSIHAMTPSLKPLDGLCLRGKHWRDHRSIHQNIIPASTGACKALGKIIPQVKDKLSGLAFRVPIVNVSVLDMSIRLSSNTSIQDIVKSVEKASKTYLQNIIKISTDDAVSSDFIGDSHSCILDVDSSLQLRPNFFKLICWYENEYSYACRVLDSIFFSEKQFTQVMMFPTKLTYVRAKLVKKQDVLLQTERNNKEKSIECNYSTETHTIFSGLEDFQFNAKPLQIAGPLLLKKPLSSHVSGTATTSSPGRDTKKRNEAFKIWNDEFESPKSSIRSNRGSLFHSCIAFSPKHSEQTECMKAQERLENVKKEFSKMLHITEDLLKKSYLSKAQSQTTGNNPKENTELVAYSELNVASVEESRTKHQFSYPKFKECGDFKVKPTSDEEIKSYHPGMDSRSYTISSETKKNDKDESIKTKLQELQKEEYKMEECQNVEEEEEDDEKVKSETSVTEENSITDSSLNNTNTVEVDLSGKKKDLTNEDNENNIIIEDNNITELKSIDNVFIESNPCFPLIETSENIVNQDLNTVEVVELESPLDLEAYEPLSLSLFPDDKTDEVIKQELGYSFTQLTQNEINHSLSDFTKYLRNKNYNMHIIDEELRKRNILLVNSDIDINLLTESEILALETDNSGKDVDPNQQKNLDPKPVDLGVVDLSSDSPENTVTTNSNYGRKIIKQDLYDKLDSASGTDSNNSFEINERKSQVLHITDLTNSLEDLARLDKICRIIEISDELSDKLFSNLDNEDNSRAQQKKWSFRDLCERIQLDEFCNKVFGKTSA